MVWNIDLKQVGKGLVKMINMMLYNYTWVTKYNFNP